MCFGDTMGKQDSVSVLQERHNWVTKRNVTSRLSLGCNTIRALSPQMGTLTIQFNFGWRTKKCSVKSSNSIPSWCGSMDGVLACKPKGHWFNSQSGHMPGLQTGSPELGRRGVAWEATTHWCDVSLPLFLPPPLKINKIFKKKKKLKL